MGKDWREFKVEKRKLIDINDEYEQALEKYPEDVPYNQWEAFVKQCTTYNCKVSDDEVAFLAHGDANGENNVLSLWYDGLKLLIVTDGKKGCRYFTKGIVHLQHTLEISPRNVVAYFGLASRLLGLSKECVNNGAFSWGASLLKEASDVANADTIEMAYITSISSWKNKRLIRISAKVESTIHAQSVTTQTSFNSLMPKISQLRESVKSKRLQLINFNKATTTSTIIQSQMPHLDEWSALEVNYSTSLSGAITALQATSLRLPVNENVRVDIEGHEGALNSASNVIETMSSHFQSFLPKVEEIVEAFASNRSPTIRDGMNLTPYEYIVCRQGVSGLGSGSDSSGIKKSMLVVSEFVGCSPSLSGVIRINLWNIETIGEALNEAISMEESKKQLLHEKHYRCEAYQVFAIGLYSREDEIGYVVLSNALSESKNSSLSSVKIAPWVYITDKIESDLVASIEHLRSKIGLGECEEVLKPIFIAQFGKVVFHGVMGIDGKRELHKIEMNQVHYYVINMSCLDKNLDLRLMLSTKRILTAQPDDEMHKSLRTLIKSAIVNPKTMELQWPFGKDSLNKRYFIAEAWRTKSKAF
ncbi:hypothetical protein GIB67_028986 [Kingdonia uniflora]|uniref:DUF7903 domain-containing protein n=1 Tax=Kingdonia uniflora TaxID=39325 RepID=A0A7J7LCC1_9MAGN|nr:hypothetical protein GIB67_028986 [Kingdonia uniflora]